jgi:hypothetical protein
MRASAGGAGMPCPRCNPSDEDRANEKMFFALSKTGPFAVASSILSCSSEQYGKAIDDLPFPAVITLPFSYPIRFRVFNKNLFLMRRRLNLLLKNHHGRLRAPDADLFASLLLAFDFRRLPNVLRGERAKRCLR